MSHGTTAWFRRTLVWKQIATALNKIKEPKFKVDCVSVCNNYKLYGNKFKEKQNKEVKSRGINPPEGLELNHVLRDCIEQFREVDQTFETEKSKQDIKML